MSANTSLQKQTSEGLTYANGVKLGSGMDNTPRTGSGWTDMSCQMVMQYRDLAEMAGVLGRQAEADDYKAAILDIMKTPPSFAPDLPIDAEAAWGETYGDAK